MTGLRRRPVGGFEDRRRPVLHQVPEGWVVLFWGITPKLGLFFAGWEFPHFWGEHGGHRGSWLASLDGQVPGGTYVFDSGGQAEDNVDRAYPPDGCFLPGLVMVPSLDRRRLRPQP